MRKIEIKCGSKKAAIEKVKRVYGITVVKDLTKAWKEAGEPLDKDKFLFFILEELAKYDLEGENLGVIITTKSSPNPVRKNTRIVSYDPLPKQDFLLQYGIFEEGSNVCLEMVKRRKASKSKAYQWYKKLRVCIEVRKMFVPKRDATVYRVLGDDTGLETRNLSEFIIVGFSKWLN